MNLSELITYADEKYHIREEHKWPDFPGYSVMRSPKTGKWIALLIRQWNPDTKSHLERCDLKCSQQTLIGIQDECLSTPFRMHGNGWIGVQFGESTSASLIRRLFDQAVSFEPPQGYTLDVSSAQALPLFPEYQETPVPPRLTPLRPSVPTRILSMRRIRTSRATPFNGNCRTFFVQAKFMENYQDDFVCEERYDHLFPTYDKLSIPLLRGYFAWRTALRNGEYRPSGTSFPALYAFELMNGIGASSPQDTFQKMKSLKEQLPTTGMEANELHKHFRRWLFEYAVIYNLPRQEAMQFAFPGTIQADSAITTLQKPESHTDGDICNALFSIVENCKLKQSPALLQDEARGTHLIAEIWRHASANFHEKGHSFFERCFGGPRTYPWYPLNNAVYWERRHLEDREYPLDECRNYVFRDGKWQMLGYEIRQIDKSVLLGFLHETDRQLRKYLKTGHLLKERKEEAWAAPYISAVLASDAKAIAEAARPIISIDLSSLEQIRRDADVTRDSLLTEEEMEPVEPATAEASLPFQHDLDGIPQQAESPGNPDGKAPAPGKSAVSTPGNEPGTNPPPNGLDDTQTCILRLLLNGESPADFIRENHLMPSLLADSINEALFDEIGDMPIECEGENLAIIEDYTEDIRRILGENI